MPPQGRIIQQSVETRAQFVSPCQKRGEVYQARARRPSWAFSCRSCFAARRAWSSWACNRSIRLGYQLQDLFAPASLPNAPKRREGVGQEPKRPHRKDHRGKGLPRSPLHLGVLPRTSPAATTRREYISRSSTADRPLFRLLRISSAISLSTTQDTRLVAGLLS